MSREQLIGLATDVTRVLAAGAPTASGSDKLRTRARAVREVAKQLPAVTPLADAVDKLVQSPPKQAGPALLDLVVMTRQLRTGLSTVGLGGDMQPPPVAGPWTTPLHTRDAKSLEDALVKSGSGREETLTEAAKKGRLADLRLLALLVDELGSSNTSIAELVATEGLPQFGPAALPEVEPHLNLQGKALDARRLLTICRIDREKGLGYCRKAKAEGSVPMKKEALERLPEVGEPGEAERAGLELYQDKSKEVRVAALAALCKATSDEALEVLVTALANPDYEVNSEAHSSLVEMPHPKATPRLLAELTKAMAALEEAEAALAQAKKDAKKKTAKAPAKKGKKAAKTPVEQATERLEEAQEHANRVMHVLGQRKDDHRVAAAETLIPLTKHKNLDIRDTALTGLGNVGAVTDAVVPTLMEVLGEKKSSLVETAVQALGEIDPPKRVAAVPKLLEILANPKTDASVQQEIVEILPKHADTHLEPVMKALKAVLKGKNKWMAGEAAEALGEIGPPAKKLLPDVIAAMKLADYYWSFGDALQKIDPEGKEAIPALIGMLKERRAATRAVAAMELGGYGAAATEALPLLEKLLKDRDWSVKYQAEQAIEAIRNPKPKPPEGEDEE